MNGYEIAQICLNGHLITSNVELNPQFKKDFCNRCGEETICYCLNCKHPIKGNYHSSTVKGFLDNLNYNIPKFCDICGKSFPWFKNKLVCAYKYVEQLDCLNTEEKADLKYSITEFVKETPNVFNAKVILNECLSKVDDNIRNDLINLMRDILGEENYNEVMNDYVTNKINSILSVLNTGRVIRYSSIIAKLVNDKLIVVNLN